MRFKYFLAILGVLLGAAVSPAFAAGDAEFTLILPGKTVPVGKPFTLQIYIDSGPHAVDTARLEIGFSADLLSASNPVLNGQLTSASPGNFVNNTTGVISWGAFTVDNPVIKKGNYGFITFTPKAVGEANIQILGRSKLIDDGEEVINTAILGRLVIANLVIPTKTTIQIVPATEVATSPNLQLSSPTHSDSNKWYQASTAQLKWANVGNGQYLWGLDQSPDTLPVKPITGLSKQIFGIKNGIWYFHLSTVVTGANKPIVAHYRIQVDNLQPNPIKPYLDINGPDSLVLNFATTDYHSGVASYDLRINQTVKENATSPYKLEGLNVGTNSVTVTAYDKAGNLRTDWLKFTLDPDGTIQDISTSGSGSGLCGTLPWVCDSGWPVKAVGGLLIIFLIIWFMRHQRVTLSNVKTVTHTTVKTDPKTGKKLVTESVTRTDEKKTEDTLGVKANSDAVEETTPTPPHKKKHG